MNKSMSSIILAVLPFTAACGDHQPYEQIRHVSGRVANQHDAGLPFMQVRCSLDNANVTAGEAVTSAGRPGFDGGTNAATVGTYECEMTESGVVGETSPVTAATTLHVLVSDPNPDGGCAAAEVTRPNTENVDVTMHCP
jgi:hypothetical protein